MGEKMNRAKRTIIIGIGTLILITACGEARQSNEKKQITPVRIASVREESISNPIYATGRVYAGEMVKLSFKTGGLIAIINANEGDEVSHGELLAKLDLSEIEARVGQARVAIEKAERDLERAQKLYKDRVATLEQLENAGSAYEYAAADMRVAKFNLEHSEIRAPAGGAILKRLAEQGEMIGPGMPVFVFGSGEESWVVRVGIVDRDIVRIELGDSVDIQLDAYPDKTFLGFVGEIAEAPDPNTGIFEVEIIIENGVEKLVTGLVAKSEIRPAKRELRRIVPIHSLVEIEGSEGFVYTIDRSKMTASKTPVVVSRATGREMIIESGLENVAEVITDGVQYLSHGRRIKIVEDQAE